MPMPLIATDLDGTLLLSGTSQPHPDAVAAIHRAIAAGIQIVFATGRPPVDVVPIADLVGHRWYAVCNDGTALVDLHSEEVFATHPFELDTKRAIVAKLRAQFPDVRFLVDRVAQGRIEHNRWGLAIESGFPAPWAEALAGATTVADIDEVMDDPDVIKICAYRPASGIDTVAFSAMAEVVDGLATPIRIHSDETFMDMCPLGISKASGVAAIAEIQGISSEHVFAVGDLHNDAEMLKWAGFAFAPSNAHPHVQDIADVIVPSNDDGGVAHVVEAAMAHLLNS